jgi:hypothetical protein
MGTPLESPPGGWGYASKPLKGFYCPTCEHPWGYHALKDGCSMPLGPTGLPLGRNDVAFGSCKCRHLPQCTSCSQPISINHTDPPHVCIVKLAAATDTVPVEKKWIEDGEYVLDRADSEDEGVTWQLLYTTLNRIVRGDPPLPTTTSLIRVKHHHAPPDEDWSVPLFGPGLNGIWTTRSGITHAATSIRCFEVLWTEGS